MREATQWPLAWFQQFSYDNEGRDPFVTIVPGEGFLGMEMVKTELGKIFLDMGMMVNASIPASGPEVG